MPDHDTEHILDLSVILPAQQVHVHVDLVAAPIHTADLAAPLQITLVIALPVVGHENHQGVAAHVGIVLAQPALQGAPVHEGRALAATNHATRTVYSIYYL